MPLARCPDCGHGVSDRATACPNCGRPSRLSEQVSQGGVAESPSHIGNTTSDAPHRTHTPSPQSADRLVGPVVLGVAASMIIIILGSGAVYWPVSPSDEEPLAVHPQSPRLPHSASESISLIDDSEKKRLGRRDMHDALLRSCRELDFMQSRAKLLHATSSTPGDARDKELGEWDRCIQQTEAIDLALCPSDFQQAFTSYIVAMKDWRSVRATKTGDTLDALIGKSAVEGAALGFMGYEATKELDLFRKSLKAASDVMTERLKAAHTVAVRQGATPIDELSQLPSKDGQ